MILNFFQALYIFRMVIFLAEQSEYMSSFFPKHTKKKAVLVNLMHGLNTISNNKIYVDYCFALL